MLLELPVREIIKRARMAKAQTGRPVAAQIIDIARLRAGPGKLSAKEYFDYRLFDPSLPIDEKYRFAGKWIKGVVYQAQDQQWTGLGNDKLLAYLFLGAIGLQTPPVRAVYDGRRYYPGVDLLDTPAALTAWLREPANYPFFAKPAAGAFGADSCFATEYDKSTDSIVTINGARIPVEEFAGQNWNRHLGGLILQHVIALHPDLVDRIGNRVGTARIFTMQTPDGPRIHRAVFRIPTGANFTDNFNLGSSGNGFAIIDPATGVMTDVYKGIGLSLQRIDSHVDTGKKLEGFKLPHWDRAVSAVLLGQRALRGLPLLGWDIALTEAGPVVVEFNTHPGYAILQAVGKGLMDPTFMANFPADPVESRRLHPHLNIGTGDRRKRR